jgi:hypothetical protein
MLMSSATNPTMTRTKASSVSDMPSSREGEFFFSPHKLQIGYVSSRAARKYSRAPSPGAEATRRSGKRFSPYQREETVMPAFVIPVLIGIPVLAIGGWFIFRAVG